MAHFFTYLFILYALFIIYVYLFVVVYKFTKKYKCERAFVYLFVSLSPVIYWTNHHEIISQSYFYSKEQRLLIGNFNNLIGGAGRRRHRLKRNCGLVQYYTEIQQIVKAVRDLNLGQKIGSGFEYLLVVIFLFYIK